MKLTTKLSLLASGFLASLPSAMVFATTDCSTENLQAIAPNGTIIDSAEALATPVAHCKIDGHIITTDPGPNQVNFRLQLPDENWNKRYYFIGMGGSAGYVPTNSQIPAGNPLFKGFAVAGTDTGRQGHMLDWGFLANPAKAEDHIHRAMHLTAESTQAITKSYYQSDTLYRYMSGCSGGGRMATESITRHPEDFDGVLLGAPGGRSNMTMAAFVYNAQQMNREPGAWLSGPKLAMLERKVTAACDQIDGAKDDIIADHSACSFDFDTLQCTSGDGPECLMPPEIRSVNAVLAGPIGPDGKPLKPGYPISNISVWSGFLGHVPPPWSDEASMENMAKSSAGYVIGSSQAKVLFGADFNALENLDFNNAEQIAQWKSRTLEIGFGAPYSSDLTGLQKSGGKVLMWNGVSDPCCIDSELEEYFLEAGEKVGGVDKLQEFATFYRVPGMAHCGGGTGPQDAPDQFLNTIIDWVENGKTPGSVVTHRGADRAQLLFADPSTGQSSGVMVAAPKGESRDFLLCPYPQMAKFNAARADDPKAVFEAKNWQCQTL